MPLLVQLNESGQPETPYKCLIKGCTNPENPEVGIQCTFCGRTVHLRCSGKAAEIDQIDEWYCVPDCLRKAREKEKSKEETSILKKQLEANRMLLQGFTERFEAKEREDAVRQAELSKCLERIKHLEEENRRLSQFHNNTAKVRILASTSTQNFSDTAFDDDSAEKITEKDALEVFATNEGDDEFKRRLTEIFKHPALAKSDSGTSLSRHKSRLEIDAMSETEKLAYYQRLHVQRLEAPKLIRYSGDPAEWLTFKASYERMKERGEYENETMVDKLRDALIGEAERYVKPRLNQPFANADQIVEALQKRFFQPKEAVAKSWERLENWSQIPDKNRKSLENFLVEIDSYIFLCKDLNFQPELQIAINSRITNKLPYAIESKWHSHIHDKDLRGNIVEFSEFMWSFVPNLPSREVSTPSNGNNSKIKASINVAQYDGQDRANLFTSKKAKKEKPDCWYCGKDKKHQLYRCDEFRKLQYDEKAKFLVNNKLCAKCISSNQHNSTTCPRASRIPKCRKKNCTDPVSHTTLMHPPSCNEAREPSDPSSSRASIKLVSRTKSTYFKVVPIYVIDGYGNKVETTLLMDRAASASLVNKDLFEKLHIPGKPHKLELTWLEPETERLESNAFLHDLIIAPINDPDKFISLNGMIALPKLSLPVQEQDPEAIKAEYPYLRNALIPNFTEQRPQILLGLPHAKWMISLETIVDFTQESAPIAERTPLGWTICGGSVPSKSIFHCCESDSQCIHKLETEQEKESLQELHELVKYYNSFESLGTVDSDKNYLCKEDIQALDVQNRTMIRDGNRYEIGLYWRNDDCSLPDNYSTALKRLCATEARLKHLGMTQWANDHQKSLREQGFVREATQDDLNPGVAHKRINYVVGFVTFNNNKQPPKPRWVVDTACKHGGVSLNSRLLKGPDNLVPLTQALFHFRERKVAVVSDVTKMYHQIRIKPEDQQVQRFLWRNCDSSKDPTIYIFQNMLFGPTCSPSQANAIRIDHCEKSAQKYPLASRIGLTSMYMDDAFNSEDTAQEGLRAARETIEMFNEISWNMVDFRSNSEEVLKQLPHESIDKELLLDLSSEEDMTSRKVLGLFWDPKKDIFTFQMTNNLELLTLSLEHDYRPTKREVLSFIMKIFDCLGLISHFHIRGRMILQAIWRRGIAWEQHIPEDIYESWIKWLKKFEEIQKLEIPRHYGYDSTRSSNVELHVFVDASPEAYAAVAYLRFTTNHQIQVAQIMAKCRVAPVKYASVPKLELMAAVIGARIANVIKTQHKRLKIMSTTFWSDSITVLRWLYSPSLKLQQFVAPRISEIQESTNVNDWRYISSEENVADDGTKWNDVDFSSSDHRWIKGPQFLYEHEQSWPNKFPSNINLEQQTILLAMNSIKLAVDMNSEYYAGIFESVRAEIRARFDLYSTVISWACRFKNNMLKAIRGEKLKKDPVLDTEELDEGEKLIFSQIQKSIFKNELKSLKKGIPVAQSSKMYALNPFLDKGNLIRAKTRMYNDETIPYDMRCPVILPNKHETIHSLLEDLHYKNKHIGIEGTIAESRSKVWIIHVRKAVKRVKHKCLYCIEMRAIHKVPPTAPLPSYRLASGSKPFEYTGADCAGPITIYAGKSFVKKDVHIVLFTCMITRAIYLRKLDTLTADEMLLAIQDLWTRRGPIRHIYSDNGRNFLGASNIIKAEHHQQLAKEKKITWHFNPPLTPHWGGVWERLIKDVKRAIKSEMHKKVIKEKLFECILLQVEDIMNSRPLTHLPVSPDDLCPITPNYLIKQHPGYAFVGDNPATNNDDLHHLTIRAKKTSEKLTKRWIKEYLPIITKSDVRRRHNKGLEVGDYVIYTDPNVKPANWKRGIIINVYKGRDNYARIADVKLLNGEILERRSAVRLAKLEIDEKSHKNCDENKILLARGAVNSPKENPTENSKFDSNCVTERNQNFFVEVIARLCLSRSELRVEMAQELNPDCVLELRNELGEAKFIKPLEIEKGGSRMAKILQNLIGLNFYEDPENVRTVRIARVPISCCFMNLIIILSGENLKIARIICDSTHQANGFFANVTFASPDDCEKAVNLGEIEIDEVKCQIMKANHSKDIMSFRKSEFSVVKWSPRILNSEDKVIIGRLRDMPTKFCAVPTLANQWLIDYRNFQRQMQEISPVVAAQQGNNRVVVDLVEIQQAASSRSLQSFPTASTSTGGFTPASKTSSTIPNKDRLKSIIVVPNYSTFRAINMSRKASKLNDTDNSDSDSSNDFHFKR